MVRETTRVSISYERHLREPIGGSRSIVPHYSGLRDYELEENVELGLIRRFLGLVDGRIVACVEVDSVSINTQLDAGIFSGDQLPQASRIIDFDDST